MTNFYEALNVIVSMDMELEAIKHLLNSHNAKYRYTNKRYENAKHDLKAVRMVIKSDIDDKVTTIDDFTKKWGEEDDC